MSDVFQQALREAERERESLRVRLADAEELVRRLRQRASQNGTRPVESPAVRANATRRKRKAGPARATRVTRATGGRGRRVGPVPTQIRESFMAARRPMNFMQIAEALRTRGIVFPDKPEQRVRWAMKHHREMFERVARGTYVLREWPAELKQKA